MFPDGHYIADRKDRFVPRHRVQKLKRAHVSMRPSARTGIHRAGLKMPAAVFDFVTGDPDIVQQVLGKIPQLPPGFHAPAPVVEFRPR